MKPANVLLKSSNNDPRGFTAKVSDFGLSRVEDDDNSSSFPFNSCGTAAYVAPEALICNKKVNSSVDVYAFGILMWEMYTAQRPYGNMKQQQLVEEVVMRGLRPKFPSHAPPAYIQLAQSCWSGSPNLRPTFSGESQSISHEPCLLSLTFILLQRLLWFSTACSQPWTIIR
jgi:serine/threonine protein kinase